MKNVLDHDDCGVDKQADGNRQTAKRHRVQADAQGFQQQTRECDGQWNRQRHEERRPHIPQQHQDDEHHEDATEHDRAADTAKR